MPPAIAAFISSSLIAAGASATVASAIASTLVTVGMALGVQALSSMFGRKPAASPSDRQFITRSAVTPRVRIYGRAKIGGSQVFAAVKTGIFYRVLAHCDGRLDGIEAHFIDNNEVSLDGSGNVTDAKYLNENGNPLVSIYTRAGVASQPTYTLMTETFPQWTADHRGDGVAHSLTLFRQPNSDEFFNVFPSAENTSYSQLVRGMRVWDPTSSGQSRTDTSTWTWSENAGRVILDYVMHETGMRIPWEWIEPEIDSWKAGILDCAASVTTKTGASIPRYSCWNIYQYDERPVDVLERMLASCNGRIWCGPNGGVQFSAGVWNSPTVTLGDDAITSYRIAAGNDADSAFNHLSAGYVEPNAGYVENDAAPWLNAASIAAHGVRPTTAQLTCVPHHNQARRLMKQAAAKFSPQWRGSIDTNLQGLVALTERYITISISEFDTFTAEIEDIRFAIEEGGIITGLTIEFVSITDSAFLFNASTEEGTPSVASSDIVPSDIAVPGNLGVLIEKRTSAGVTFAVGVVTWDPLDISGQRVDVQYRKQSGSSWGAWLNVARSAAGAVEAETPHLVDGTQYQFRVRAVGVRAVSQWTSAITRTVTVDSVAPGVPNSLSVSASGSTATIQWRNPNSANCYGARVYRNTTNNSTTATLVTTDYGGPSLVNVFNDTSLAPDVYWWWVSAINGSGVESTRTAAGSHTIT